MEGLTTKAHPPKKTPTTDEDAHANTEGVLGKEAGISALREGEGSLPQGAPLWTGVTWTLVNVRTVISVSGQGPEALHFPQVLGMCRGPGPQTTLWG